MIVFPNAKINLGLYVISKREDGYHNIETVFLPVKNLCDVLEVISLRTDSVHDCFTISGLAVPGASDDNLCLKALRLMRQHIDIPPLNIFLHKVIPFGAGLGGGSSDAAFMLKLLNEMFDARLSSDKLECMASEIGADCAFFIRNSVTYAEGVGNRFSSVNIALPDLWLELIVPPVRVSTASAYKNIIPHRPENDLKAAVVLPVNTWRNTIENDFERPVFKEFSEPENIKETLYAKGAIYASMSGSGSAVFGLFGQKPRIEWDKSFFVYSGLLKGN